MARILYLDDEEPLAFLVSRMLQALGHEAVAFTDPQEAIDAFRTAPESFALVLTDLSMPAMNGLDFARRILESRKETAVAVLTGQALPKDVEAAREAGLIGVLQKPGTLEQMEQALAELLKASASR
jgi:CheY-like chemotaxis protein